MAQGFGAGFCKYQILPQSFERRFQGNQVFRRVVYQQDFRSIRHATVGVFRWHWTL